MIDKYIDGANAACARLGIKVADMMPPGAAAGGGIMSKLKSFGQGQLDAGKALVGNLRGGLGGQSPHALPPGMEGPVVSPEGHRQMALGNLKTLAPSLLAGGGLYLMHKRKQEQQRQQAMMQQSQGYGAPPM